MLPLPRIPNIYLFSRAYARRYKVEKYLSVSVLFLKY